MQIIATDLATLTFAPVQNDKVTERVFTVTHTIGKDTHDHLVLVHVDKRHNDTDGDGTIDTLDGKFCLSIIDSSGTAILVNDRPINIAQVHGVNVETISSAADVVNWISDISIELIPIVINKKSALESWGVY